MISPHSAGTADEVDALVAALYGGPLELDLPSVIHVAAMWQSPAGSLQVIRITEESPRSPWDAFALNLARARAGVILTTGAILRAEPEVRYTLQGPGLLPEGLRLWRHARMGPGAPTLAVLTSGHALDFHHPAFHTGQRVQLHVPSEVITALKTRAPSSVEIVGHAELTARGVVQLLAAQPQVVVVEAGPSTTTALYDTPALVNELMLSTYLHPDLPKTLRGGHWTRDPTFFFKRRAGESAMFAPEGRWRFGRYLDPLQGEWQKNGKK
ncbi:MAG: hypothetical protein ACE366_13285 [Bradymonadia bacterium]